MLNNRATSGSGSHLVRTMVDRKLMERSGLDELNLRRVRRAFMEAWGRMPYQQKFELTEGSITLRYRFVTDLLQRVWSSEIWHLWLRYLEHSEDEIVEMREGEYPISPYLVRLFSALLGIKVDFLLLGAGPSDDQQGLNIDAYPVTMTQV